MKTIKPSRKKYRKTTEDGKMSKVHELAELIS
jgi:flagellar biosynthesis protein FlhB